MANKLKSVAKKVLKKVVLVSKSAKKEWKKAKPRRKSYGNELKGAVDINIKKGVRLLNNLIK